MRTKTVLLSALLGTLGTASLMAQTTNVYSLNAVGYINVTCPPGFSIIADQLAASGGNALSNLLNNADGHLNGSGVYKWTGSSYSQDFADTDFGDPANGWDNHGQITLNPGEAAWFQNTASSNIVLTFVGTVPQGTLTNHLSTGFNMVSSQVPQSGDLVTGLGLSNYNNGDAVYVYDTSIHNYVTYFVDFDFGNSGYQNQWVNNGDPQVAVGQGFWYQASAPLNWTRNFSVNQ